MTLDEWQVIAELAQTIFAHRMGKFATGEDGLVEPHKPDAMGRAMLEEWCLDQARKHKTMEAYLETQKKGHDELQQAVTGHIVASNLEVVNQDFIRRAIEAKAERIRKLWN